MGIEGAPDAISSLPDALGCLAGAQRQNIHKIAAAP